MILAADVLGVDEVEFLHEHVGWDVWMVTRVVDDSQIVLCAAPEGPVRPGARLLWEDSFCREMIEGRAPRVATVTAAVPAYAVRTNVSPVGDMQMLVQDQLQTATGATPNPTTTTGAGTPWLAATLVFRRGGPVRTKSCGAKSVLVPGRLNTIA